MSKFKVGDKITFCGYNSFVNEISVDDENYKCLDNQCSKECFEPHTIISTKTGLWDCEIDFIFSIESGEVNPDWPDVWFRLYKEPHITKLKSRFELIFQEENHDSTES